MYSDPMPGENYENAAEREKARAEREAIANGENFNPNLSEEAAEGFSNLESEVPFAGDNVAMTAAELAVEGPAVTAADVAVGEGLNLAGDMLMSAGDGQTPSEMADGISSEKHDSDNAIAQEFNEQWDQGKTPDLDDVQEQVERDYIDGAVEQSATNPDIQADLANTERNSNDTPNSEEAPLADQPHDIAEAAAIQSVSAAALSEELAEDIKAGDEEAIARIDEVTQRANEAIETAEKVNMATQENVSEDSIEARMATDVAAQAQEKAYEAIEAVESAKAEYDSMSDEEKEETKAAAEAAEQNGTTIEEEKAKAEEEKEDDTPVLARGIFS